MALAGELLAKRAVVVDLAVQNGGHRAVLVGDRGIPGYEVDDGQAVLGDHATPSREEATRVRAAMVKTRELGVDDALYLAELGRSYAADAAHSGVDPARSQDVSGSHHHLAGGTNLPIETSACRDRNEAMARAAGRGYPGFAV